MGVESGPRHFRQLACRTGRQRQRRGGGTNQADAQLNWVYRADLCDPEQDGARECKERGREVRPAEHGQRDGRRGGISEGYAGGFPSVDHERRGKGLLSDLELHVAADPDQDPGPGKKKALVDFLHWMLDNDAQAMAETLDYARLPKAVVAKEIKAIAKIQ